MAEVMLPDGVVIPEWVKDHRSYRRWAHSDAYPERGWISYYQGRVWVDMSMERDIHNLLKTEIGAVLVLLAQRNHLGRYWSDNMFFTNAKAGLSTEPDGMFALWSTLQKGRVKFVGREPRMSSEISGSPDMVLEIVSPSSVRKDTVEFPAAYFDAGISEYWLVDPRGPGVRFDILRASTAGYRRVRPNDGWLKSRVFEASFRLAESTDPLGNPTYRLESR